MGTGERGATLTELLGVVSTMGILTSLATPMLVSNLEKAKTTVDGYNQSVIQSSIKRLVLDHPDATLTSGSLTNKGSQSASIIVGTQRIFLADALLHGVGSSEEAYLESIPLDANHKPYFISLDTEQILVSAP